MGLCGLFAARRLMARVRLLPGRRPARRGGTPAGPTPLLQLRGDRLDLGVCLESLVAHLAAPAGLLVAAKRQRGVEDVVAVDPDRARPQLLGQGVRLGDVLGPYARAEAFLGVVGGGGDVVERLERRRHDDRAEDLLADALHVPAGAGDHGGLDEVALVTPAPAAGDRRRAIQA